MGMFDEIKNRLYCPYCGKKHKAYSFQTKDFRNCLEKLDIFQIKGCSYNIYHECDKCKTWIELTITPEYNEPQHLQKNYQK